MTHNKLPAVDDIELDAALSEIADKTTTSLDAIASIKNIGQLKRALDDDLAVHDYLSAQLTELKEIVRDRVLDALEAERVSRVMAAGTILLFGADEYQGSKHQIMIQRAAVDSSRRQLAKDYKDVVPLDARSRVFEMLITPPNGHIDQGPRLDATLKVLSKAGSQKRAQLGERRKTVDTPLDKNVAHSILLFETMRMLEYYYPPTDDD